MPFTFFFQNVRCERIDKFGVKFFAVNLLVKVWTLIKSSSYSEWIKFRNLLPVFRLFLTDMELENESDRPKYQEFLAYLIRLLPLWRPQIWHFTPRSLHRYAKGWFGWNEQCIWKYQSESQEIFNIRYQESEYRIQQHIL